MPHPQGPAAAPAFPRKTRDMHNHHMDSTVWDRFAFRDDDIIIGTYGKSGTTWTQQIVGQLVFAGAEGVKVAELSPWLDLRVPPADVKFKALAAQKHRRFIKTHLPVDAFVYRPQNKHIYVARDGRDVVWSLYNHHVKANDAWYEAMNDTPGRVGPPIGRPDPDIRAYFLNWLDNDGAPFWPFWENIRSWWEIRDLPNMLLIHFNDMKRDMPGAIATIADFLEIDLDDETFETVCEHCSFDYMKRNADTVAPLGGAIFEGGAKSFINKGTNGRWRDVLTAEDCARYEAHAVKELGEECAAWLKDGSAA